MSKKFGLSPAVSSAIFFILIGILFCIFRQSVIAWGMLVFGILLIVKGVLDAINGNVTSAVITIVIGALLIILRYALPDFIIQVTGIILAVSGIAQLFNGQKKKLLPLISCILTVVAGLLIVFNSGETLSVIFLVSGILFIVDGLLSLVGIVK